MARKIMLQVQSTKPLEDVFEEFVISRIADGLSDVTIRNYRNHIRSISKHLDITMPINTLRRKNLDVMIVSMKKAGLAHNSISAYCRVLRTFLNWCDQEDICSVEVPHIKDKEVIKETYTDEELEKLLKKPGKNCDFAEYRNWTIINFLMNCGCRASTVRNIRNEDVDLDRRQIIFRHTKNGKPQVVPLCSVMLPVLRDYMKVRRGRADEYLFCDVYGEMLSENALRLAIARYNHSRGVQKTSIHLFRHTFARKYLVDCGGDPFMLQKLLGHSSLKMTKHYCAIYDADIANNFDQFSPLTKIGQPKQRIRRHR